MIQVVSLSRSPENLSGFGAARQQGEQRHSEPRGDEVESKEGFPLIRPELPFIDAIISAAVRLTGVAIVRSRRYSRLRAAVLYLIFGFLRRTQRKIVARRYFLLLRLTLAGTGLLLFSNLCDIFGDAWPFTIALDEASAARRGGSNIFPILVLAFSRDERNVARWQRRNNALEHWIGSQ